MSAVALVATASRLTSGAPDGPGVASLGAALRSTL